jgi:hypothetical protein
MSNNSNQSFFDRVMLLDRRWVFLVLAVVVVSTYYIPMNVPVPASREVQTIFDAIEGLEEGQKILLAIDYDPNALAELHPMTYAIMEQCFRKKVGVIITSLSQNGPGMAEQAILDIVDSTALPKTYNGVSYPGRKVINGVDYCFLGYRAYFELVITGLGQNFRTFYSRDYYDVLLDSIPIMKDVQNYDDIEMVIDISGSNVVDAWIKYAAARYDVKLALGLTGVMTADYYPYLGSGRVFGLMGGLLGAAEYERLADNPGLAMDGMKVQVWAHLTIIAFIIIANVGYFGSRKKRGLQ